MIDETPVDVGQPCGLNIGICKPGTTACVAGKLTCEGGVASIGRSPADASRAWRPLLAWAARLGLTPPESVRLAIAADGESANLHAEAHVANIP